MRISKATLHSLPFADCMAANTLSAAEVQRLGWVGDPRWYDLPEDTHLWLGLLAAARALDGDEPQGLFGALHGLRCLGARLESSRRGMCLHSGEIGRNDYRVLRETYLVPHAERLRRLLTHTAREDGVEWLTV